MGWQSLNTGLTGGATVCQLMTDGRLMVAITAVPSVSRILTPDSTGSYLNGTWATAQTMPNHYAASCSAVTDRGDVLVIGSENAGGAETISRYNRATGTWSQVSASLADHNGRTGFFALANGRIIARKGGQRVAVDQAGGTYGHTSGDVGAGTESSYTITPNGDLWSFPALTGGFGVGSPGQMYKLDPDGLNGVLDIVTLPTYTATAFAYPGGTHWIDTLGVGYEIGGPMWFPKLGRLVIVGGEMGELFAFNPATNTLEVAGRITPRPHPNFGWATQATVPSGDVGRTGTQIQTRGTFTYTVSTIYACENSLTLFVGTSPGRFFKLSGGTRTINGTNSPTGIPVTGDVVVRSGFSVSLDTGTAIESGAVISTGPQATRCAEGWQAILPSGDMVFIGSICVEQFSFGNYGDLYRWNGTDTPTRIDTTRPSAPTDLSGSHNSMAQMLPNGQLAVLFGPYLWLYTDDVAADPANAPTITKVASRVFPGASFVLQAKQLHGRHVGAHFGDEYGLTCNHPQVRLTNTATSAVRYCNVHSWDYRGIEPNRVSSAIVDLPSDLAVGTYELRAISAGNVSKPVTITCDTKSSQSMVV